MSRRSHLLLLVVLVSVGYQTPAVAADDDWPMVRQNPQNTAFVRIRTRTPATIRAWQYQAGSHVWGYQPGMTVWSSPALAQVAGRAVLFAGSYDRNLHVLDATTGRKLWRYTTGGGVYATPTVWHKNDRETLVFVASSDRLVYALDADVGKRVWVHAVKTWRPTMGGARLSAPCVGRAGERAAVFVGHWVWDKSVAGHLQAGGLTALSALTGKHLWTAELGDNRVGSAIFATTKAGGRVFVASENGNVHALNAADGKVLWSHADRDAIMGTPALFSGPAGPMVIYGSKFGRVRALDGQTGRTLWSFRTGHWVDGSPAVTGDGPDATVLVGSYDTHLYALSATAGVLRWKHRTAAGVYASPAVVRRRDKGEVLFSAWDHHLYSVDLSDGALRWNAYTGRPLWDSITLGDSTWSSPAVAEINGRAVVYVGSYAGPIHAIPLDEAAKKAVARPGSNIDFWITLPGVMLAVALLTVGLTRMSRHRKQV